MPDNYLQQQTMPAFERAQAATIALTRSVVNGLQPGMSERDVCLMARRMADEQPLFTGWFHTPEVYFDRVASRWPSRDRGTLRPGTLVQIDLAPATDDAFGKFGYSFTFQGEEHAAVTEARRICQATCGFSSRFKCVGELFVFAHSWANNHRIELHARHAIGHTCLPREGLTNTQWPLMARMATRLRRNQVQWYNPRRILGIYTVNPPVHHNGRVAAFEEMIYIDGETKRVLGRTDIDQIGSL
jgi:hypothetical protein